MSSSREFPLAQPEIRFETAAGSLVRRTVLPNGLRILSEAVPASRSATLGFWIAVGSRDEHAHVGAETAEAIQRSRAEAGEAPLARPSGFGSTHFLEHLLFKGTPERTALEIAIAFDSVGGEHNALTAKEHTCYYAKVRDQDLSMATAVISDMVTSSLLDPEEFESERGVILEELAMSEDDPASVAGEAFFAEVLGEHPLGRPIGGTPETIAAATREAVLEHYRANYRPRDLVITAAGSVDHDVLVADVSAALERAGWGLEETAEPVARRATEPARIAPAGGVRVIHRPTEQVHLMIGGPGIVTTDERRLQLSVLSSILGGGMSSRLFQEVRERRGLAYTVYSFASSYSDAGLFGMYAACAPAKARQVADLCLAGLRELAATGVTADEMDRAVGQLSGASALALEDSDTRMSRLGRAELSFGTFTDLDETLEKLSRVTAEQVRALAAELASAPPTLVAVGAVSAETFDGFGSDTPGEQKISKEKNL